MGEGNVWHFVLELAEAAGTTTLTFGQSVPDAEMAAGVGPGWEYYLDRLVAAETGAERRRARLRRLPPGAVRAATGRCSVEPCEPSGRRRRRSGAAFGHDGPMSEIEIPRPTSGDVLERILEDHRLFEDLLRLARRTDTDREAARAGAGRGARRPRDRRGGEGLPDAAHGPGDHRPRGGARRGGARRDHRGAAGVPAGQGHRHPEVRRRARGARDGGQPPLERGGADDHQPGPRGRLARGAARSSASPG